MKIRGFILALLSTTFISIGHAEINQQQMLAQNIPIPQDELAKLIPNSTHNNPLPELNQKHMEAIQQNRRDILENLQAQLSVLNTNSALKSQLSNDLRQAQSAIASVSPGDHVEKVNVPMNFLNIQIGDAEILLISTQVAAKLTLATLYKMQDNAASAASGTYSATELSQMNNGFQGYKALIPLVQSAFLLNGRKVLSGGDITIRIGNTSSKHSTLTIPIKPFDPKTLNITETSIDTLEHANQSLRAVNAAIEYMNEVVAAVNRPFVEDAETMLASIPYVLSNDYMIYGTMLSVIIAANNGTVSDQERNELDLYFNYLKAALEKNQTYVSLGGIKTLGGGSIDIQIGPKALRETTLQIKLPSTSIKAMRLDKVSLLSPESANAALSIILKDLHDFAYMAENR